MFELSNHVKFESIRAISTTIVTEDTAICVSDLQDVIDAKRAADRPKDHVVLTLLEDFHRVREAMPREEEEDTD